MNATVPDILGRIVARKKEELSAVRAPRAALELRAAAMRSVRRNFEAALRAKKPAIIGEIKKASPSKGVLAAEFDPAATAAQYAKGGAAALSVLTDRDFFQGSLHDLEAARAAVHLPALRKDFVIDEYHVIEAAAHGADAILLIAAILDERRIRDFRELAARYGMAALVEVHDEREVEIALNAGAGMIGVNNRDLRSFEVKLETSLTLAEKLPARVLKISESGIHTAAHIEQLSAAGFDAFLVGEHLMKSSDPAAAMRALLN